MAEFHPMVGIYHILFKHSLIDKYLGCFHFLGILNNAATSVMEGAMLFLIGIDTVNIDLSSLHAVLLPKSVDLQDATVMVFVLYSITSD